MTDKVASKIHQLKDELNGLEAEIERIKVAIIKKQAQLEILNEVAHEIRNGKFRPDPPPPPADDECPPDADVPFSGKLPPKAAVMSLLRFHPDGLTSIEITDRLEGRIVTESKDQRRVLQQTLINMAFARLLEKNSTTGVYTIKKEPR